MTARVQIPKSAKRGEVIEVRIAIQHPMETGFRFGDDGKPAPKNVVNKLVCRYNGAEIFRAEMGSGIAANPSISFFTVAQDSGELVFDWIDDKGVTGSERVQLTVNG
jgi:sulfur-oxidizing protein SoxZ